LEGKLALTPARTSAWHHSPGEGEIVSESWQNQDTGLVSAQALNARVFREDLLADYSAGTNLTSTGEPIFNSRWAGDSLPVAGSMANSTTLSVD